MFPKVTMPRINLSTHTGSNNHNYKIIRCLSSVQLVGLVPGHSPGLIHHGRLVEALLFEDFDRLLTADSWQDGERG